MDFIDYNPKQQRIIFHMTIQDARILRKSLAFASLHGDEDFLVEIDEAKKEKASTISSLLVEHIAKGHEQNALASHGVIIKAHDLTHHNADIEMNLLDLDDMRTLVDSLVVAGPPLIPDNVDKEDFLRFRSLMRDMYQKNIFPQLQASLPKRGF